MTIRVEISVGELLDKITILEIKAARIQDPDKLANVHKELQRLRYAWSSSPCSQADIANQLARLKAINEQIWDIEDGIRRKELTKQFDDEFIDLARSVYPRNDERAAIKRELNHMLGSDLVEEKSYVDYSHAEDPDSG
jgi:hypothetical protein